MSNFITIFARDLYNGDVVNTPSGIFKIKFVKHSVWEHEIIWEENEKIAPFNIIPGYWLLSVELTDIRQRRMAISRVMK